MLADCQTQLQRIPVLLIPSAKVYKLKTANNSDFLSTQTQNAIASSSADRLKTVQPPLASSLTASKNSIETNVRRVNSQALSLVTTLSLADQNSGDPSRLQRLQSISDADNATIRPGLLMGHKQKRILQYLCFQ